MQGRPPNLSVPSARGGPKVIGTTIAYFVNKPIPTWEKFNSSLGERGRGQSRTSSIFEQSFIRECLHDER
jgi:hypothetical protein